MLTPVIATDSMETSDTSPTTIDTRIAVHNTANYSSTNDIDMNTVHFQASSNIDIQNQNNNLSAAERLLNEFFNGTIQTDARSFDGFSNTTPANANQGSHYEGDGRFASSFVIFNQRFEQLRNRSV